MKKILIVDDNESNRIILRVLLENYAENTGEEIKINEAVSGLEAALMVEDTRFNLIFVDIMMPVMDGIEATRRIRAYDAKVMIVAVSGVAEGERQRQILRNGAEDYIIKPINEDIFTARLRTYFSLIDSRSTSSRKFNPSAANLFTNEVFSRKFLFYVQSEDDLAQFWEHYLLDIDVCSHDLSDAIRTVHALALIELKMGEKLQIIVEESMDQMFVTLTCAEDIDPKIVKLVMAKNPSVTKYKTDQGKFCIRLPRPCKSEPVNGIFEAAVASPVLQIPVVTYSAIKEESYVYAYMDDEDLMDLREYVGKLNSLMLVVGGEIESYEVDEISDSLQHIGRISCTYSESYPIGNALAAMGRAIANHSALFMAKSNDLAPMCTAFGRDLDTWIRMIFVDGASNVHFMDDTIIVNAQTIEGILTMDDTDFSSSAENLDDIFDF